jgi:hypothetical protein
MTDTAHNEPHETHRFEGRQAFQDLVRGAFDRAAQHHSATLWLSDASFEDWPLGERAVIDSLNAWCQNGRRVFLLAKRFDHVQREHHRFVAWRQRWSHIIEARARPSSDAVDFPSIIWTLHWTLQRIDPQRSIGISSNEPARRVALQEQLSEYWQQATPAFAATTLGL